MKHLLLLLGLAMASTGCKQEVAAGVLCQINEGPKVDCNVTQTKGTTEIEVCWNYKAECANKATLESPKMCTKVKDGGAGTASASGEQLKISGPCEGETKGSVFGLTINGEVAK